MFRIGAEKTDGDCTPYAADAVHGDSTNRVINFDAIRRKAAKKVNAASVTSMTTSSVKVNAEPTKAELAQRALKEWTLMDVVVHVEDLHIVLSADDGQTDVMEVHLM